MQFNFLRHRRIYYIFSGLLIAASVGAIVVFGLRFGIEFTGGSILEVEYADVRPSNSEIRESLAGILSADPVIQPTGEKGVLIRMKETDEDMHQRVLEALKADAPAGGKVTELRFEAIGPVIGKELGRKTWIATALAVVAILLYIALAFRRVSRPVSSWRYGVIAAGVAFLHDAFLPIGAFAVLGAIVGAEISIPVIAALLTVIGYSINDTVVVFDRVRENLIRRAGVSFEDTVELSLRQTWVRSLNTSLTTLFVLAAIFFFGGTTLSYFSLVLIIGVAAGTYSSLFLAAPLLVDLTRKKGYA